MPHEHPSFPTLTDSVLHPADSARRPWHCVAFASPATGKEHVAHTRFRANKNDQSTRRRRGCVGTIASGGCQRGTSSHAAGRSSGRIQRSDHAEGLFSGRSVSTEGIASQDQLGHVAGFFSRETRALPPMASRKLNPARRRPPLESSRPMRRFYVPSTRWAK